MPAVHRVWIMVAVAVGGALGTVARYELALAEPIRPGRFPWATFGVNVVGSLALGMALTVLVAPGVAVSVLRPFIGVGVCGGLTTFSTWMVESVLLVRDGEAATAVGYLLLSLVAGLAAVWVGVAVTRRFVPPADAVGFDPGRDD